MPAANAFAIWEAFKNISGLFGGKGKPEDPLTQQTASALMPTFDDEAIQTALDTALYNIDPQYLEKVQKVRAALEPHQRDRWRKVIATLQLTEKFEENVVSERTIKTNGSDVDQAIDSQAQSQRRRMPHGKQGREEITRTFDRRKRDYEYTAEDPRVQHLVFIGKLVAKETDEKKGVAKAKSYLLSGGMILEKSFPNQIIEKASQIKADATDTVYKFVAEQVLGSDTFNQVVPPRPKKDALAKALDEKYEAKKRERKALRASRFTPKCLIFTGIGIFIIIVMATIAIYS